MAPIFSAVYLLAVGTLVVFQLETAQHLSQAAERFAGEWGEEYQLRRCLQLAAAAANLRASAAYLAGVAPAAKPGLDAAAGRIAEAVAAHYALAAPSGGDACRAPGLGLAGTLHLQHSPGQPAHWPNWIGRLVTD